MHESTMLYSPHPPEAYTRPDSDTETVIGIGLEFTKPECRAAWNLYWLSDPAVDSFLLNEPEWITSPPINVELLQACVDAVRQELGGVPMRVLLSQGTAAEFSEHLRRHPHGHLKPFGLLGPAWVMTILERAAWQRGALIQEGNLYSVTFSRRPGLVPDKTEEEKETTIMPLALRMQMT